MTAARTDQRWKYDTPCRDAGDPGLFEVPDGASAEEWRLAEKVATTYCSGCPFLLGECATDPDGRWGIWAGSARWVRGGDVLFRRLIEEAPRPPFTAAKNVTPESGPRRRSRRAAA